MKKGGFEREGEREIQLRIARMTRMERVDFEWVGWGVQGVPQPGAQVGAQPFEQVVGWVSR